MMYSLLYVCALSEYIVRNLLVVGGGQRICATTLGYKATHQCVFWLLGLNLGRHNTRNIERPDHSRPTGRH